MVRSPGDVIGNRYRLLTRVGSGAYGVVYRARDLETRGEVAVKVLRKEAARDEEMSRRFEREALAMARLRGTAAVYVHALVRDPNGEVSIVMEMLQGQNLESFLHEAESRGGRLKKDKTLEILRPIARTLSQAHEKGILHRDLKPSNIFIVDAAAGGGVRLMDFGLAKVLGEVSLTAEGMVAGTPSYIAPEAWRGDPHALDHRIDVYSLAVLVFRCLSGQVPHPTPSLLELCQWAQNGERPSLKALRKSLPAAIDSWVDKALAADPQDRFQSVAAMWAALETLLAPPPTAPY